MPIPPNTPASAPLNIKRIIFISKKSQSHPCDKHNAAKNVTDYFRRHFFNKKRPRDSACRAARRNGYKRSEIRPEPERHDRAAENGYR